MRRFILFSFWLLLMVLVRCDLRRDIDSIQMMIEKSVSGDITGFKLAKLYFQLGLMFQNAWLKKEQVSQGNLLVDSLNALDSALSHIDNYNQSIPLAVQILSVRGYVLKMLGKGQEALSSYDQALAFPLHKLDLSSLHYCKADVYLMLGQLPEAIQHYEQAIALVPCHTERYHGLTTTLSEQNQLTPEEWKAYTTRLIQAFKNCKEEQRRLSDPAAIDFASSFEDYDDYQEGDLEPEEIVSFDDDSSLTSTDSTSRKPVLHGRSSESLFANKDGDLLFSIYSAADKAQDTTLAWNYLVLANAAERKAWDKRGQGFDRQRAIAGLNSSIVAFTPAILKSMPDITNLASPFPIFIVGFMRCGSTLLETMLDAHPKIWGMGEDSVFNRDLASLRDLLVVVSDREEAKDLLVGYGDRVVKEMKHMASLSLSTSNSCSSSSNNGSDSTCNNSNNKTKKVKRIVDKMLFNYRNLPFVHLVYPAAPILHLVRDPLDTLFSCFKLKFDDQGLSWSQSIPDLVLVFALYIEQVHHYRRLLPKNRITDLRYEQLVSYPEETLKKVMDKVQLPWDASMLQYYSSGRAVHTNSMTQVRRSLYKGSIGGWRKYGPQLVAAFKKEWIKYLPRLRSMGALPFDGKVNWDMDPDFDYDGNF